MCEETVEIPVIIGGQENSTGRTRPTSSPHDHSQELATLHQAGPDEVEKAATAAAGAWHEWSEMDWESRAGKIVVLT